MSCSVSFVGESERDRRFVEFVCDRVGGGEVVRVSDHPTVGDFGVCEFDVEFTNESIAREFKSVACNFGFQFS